MVLLERSSFLLREGFNEIIILAYKTSSHQCQWKIFHSLVCLQWDLTALEYKICQRQKMPGIMKIRIKIEVDAFKKKREERQEIVITLTLTLPWSLSCSRIMSTSSIVQS